MGKSHGRRLATISLFSGGYRLQKIYNEVTISADYKRIYRGQTLMWVGNEPYREGQSPPHPSRPWAAGWRSVSTTGLRFARQLGLLLQNLDHKLNKKNSTWNKLWRDLTLKLFHHRLVYIYKKFLINTIMSTVRSWTNRLGTSFACLYRRSDCILIV
jgi:hypothetical protein